MYKLYRIHPVWAPQGDGTSATINPAYRYIAQNSTNQHFLFDNKDSCLQLEKEFYCQLKPIIHTTHSCESSILNNITSMNWTQCDIKTNQQQLTQWTQLEEDEGYLFSTPQPEEIEIICNKGPTQKTTIFGFGLLRMNDSCQSITPDRIIPGSSLRGINILEPQPKIQLLLKSSQSIVENAINDVKTTLHITIAIFSLLIISLVSYTLIRDFKFSPFAPHVTNTYTVLDPLDTYTPTTTNSATQTEPIQQKVRFDLTRNEQTILDLNNRPPPPIPSKAPACEVIVTPTNTMVEESTNKNC